MELVDRIRHAGRLGEWHRNVATGQVEPVAVEAAPQFAALAQVPGRSQVDAVISGVLHRVEDRRRIRDMGIDADRDFEGAKADWGTGDGDRCGQIRRPLNHSQD